MCLATDIHWKEIYIRNTLNILMGNTLKWYSEQVLFNENFFMTKLMCIKLNLLIWVLMFLVTWYFDDWNDFGFELLTHIDVE